ncbi:Lsr2 family protein [Arthrobacter sp. MI7-26]|uniref:histone-like nucleoid-structuring protein Lsr2 n=1 Tax=Arthrobacter sp. MI7-26 TaxID=2993653 RepID=UPI0022493C25|nr:Lsr2 family protein [Arthrobacter sp. MI7-26]MCX2746266.1 Lsr2 family protein [Arthrobacter sp. MI7-26]
MAQKIVTLLEDDLDGSKASETVSFALDGVEYVIDLNEAHANELRGAVGKFTAAARKVGRVKTPARRAATGGSDTKAIRAWAIENGIPINSRGRIQADVIERYQAAH